MTRGWIKVDKEIYNGFARDKDKLRYMDLLLMSDHVPYQHKTRSGKIIEVRTGEFIVSQRQLAKKWKCRLEDVNVLLHQLTERCVLAVYKADYHEQKYTFLDRVGDDFGRNDKRNDKTIVPPEQQNQTLSDCNSADLIVPNFEKRNDKNDQVGNDKRNDYIIYKTNKTNNNNSAHVRTREEKKKFLEFIGLYNELAEKAGSEYRIRATTPEREGLYGALASKYDRATIAEAVQKSFSYPSISLEWLLKEENFIRILEGTYKSRNELKLKRNETIQDKRRGVEPLHKKDGGYRFK